MENLTMTMLESAASPPLGVKPNFVNPVSQASVLVVVSTICLIFMVVLHLQRMVVKFRTNYEWGLDDLCCTLGKLGSIGYAATCLATIMHGVGVHQWDIPVSSLSPLFLKKLYATQIILPPTFMMIKLSLLMLYLHIFYPKVILRYCIYAGMIINSLFYTGCLGAAAASWTPSSGEPWFETSFSSAYRTSITLGIVQSVFNVVSDLYLLFLPLWGVSQLQLSFKKKIGVSAIFMTGVLACLSSILTLVFRIKLVANPDTTWDLAAVYTLSIVETTVGIMCSCMPALASFVRLHTPLFHSFLSLFNSSFRRSSMGRNSSSTGYLGESRGLEDMHSSQKDLKPKGKSDGVRVTETPVSPWEEVGVKDEWLTARDMESARSL